MIIIIRVDTIGEYNLVMTFMYITLQCGDSESSPDPAGSLTLYQCKN